IFKIDASAVLKGAEIASTLASEGDVIADGELAGYPKANAEAKDQAAWVSPVPGSAALGRSYLRRDFGGTPEAIVGAEIVWVTPANTPSKLRFEFSDDGSQWHLAALARARDEHEDRAYSNQLFSWKAVGAHRFWRVTPAGSLADNFAIEFLKFRRS